MKNGEFAESKASLRAKIDMASPFMVMRDPVIYRIKFASHHQQAKNGAFTQCTILLIVSLMRLSVLHTLYAH